MKWFPIAPLLIVVSAATSSKAMACRSPPEPSELRHVEADAIILAQVANVKLTTEPHWRQWVATATKKRNILGSPVQNEFTFADTGPGSCGPGQPSLEEYWVLYLKNEGKGLRAWPFWWARASGDPRLKRLNELLPLGIVRTPTAAEAEILDLVEEKLRGPKDGTDFSNYTRVYSRSSPGSLRGVFLRSRTPKRLVADISEEGPTRESCRCELITVFIDVEDLRSWGRL